LQRQRFQFPTDWLDYDMVEGEWTAFNEILSRKSDSLASQIPALQMKIIEEEKLIDQKIRDLAGDWNNNKPVQGKRIFKEFSLLVGNIRHTTALDSLKIFEQRIQKLKTDSDRVRRAKEALNLDQTVNDGQLRPIEEEIQDLSQVWAELSASWKELDSLKETLWSAIVPRKIRHSLEEMLNNFKNIPNRMRQYAAFIHLQHSIKAFLKYNNILTDLKSEALRERHWKELRKRLNASWVLNELTLGIFFPAKF
jgi:dynein heavy chain 1